MDLEKLLKRMKYTGPNDRRDIDVLNDLCISFVSTIPYETLDNFLGDERSIRKYDLEKIFDRIVNGNRGGNCLELNMILEWILLQMRFKVQRYMGYGYDMKNDCFGLDRHHVILLVTLDDGKTWLTDVGWNGPSFVFPLQMYQSTLEQSQPSGIYKVAKHTDGHYVVEKRWQTQIDSEGRVIEYSRADKGLTLSRYQTSNDWMVIYGFKMESKPFEEIEKAFILSQTKHPFTTSHCLAILQDRYHRKFLNGNIFARKTYIDTSNIRVHKRKCTLSEVMDILKTEFGIILESDLQPKSDLPWLMA